jgi:hypothetical protein
MLPYYLRLLCLCLATFYVVHSVVWLVVRSASSASVRIAGTMRPRMASRLLFAVRMAPAAVTGFLVLGFCVPSYIWLEPDIAGERVGWFCLLAAMCGAAVWSASLIRGVISVVRTEKYVRLCRREPQTAKRPPGVADVVILNDAIAVMAVAGVVHPRLVVSRSVLDALTEEQQEAAFRHEAAHQASGDNLKRLCLLMSPDVVPFVGGLRRMERAWATFTEWAADDEAVDGDQDRALSLASALVRVAKLGVHPAPGYVLSSLLDDDQDLETRVDRLLREPAYAEKPMQPVLSFLRSAALVVGGIGATLLLWPGSLANIHQLLEHLAR